MDASRGPEAAPAVSPHRTDPAQLTLFTVRRDWRLVLGAASLASLTGAAQRLLDDFSRAQPAPGDEAAGKAVRALRILAAWLGADPGRQAEPRQHAVDRLLGSLPGQIGREASTWVAVVRGHGRVPHPALAYKTIRNYLAYLMPVLTGWASQYTSLRGVTRHDILDAIDARHGPVIRHRIVALGGLFRALRQERVIFRDPTRGISLPALPGCRSHWPPTGSPGSSTAPAARQRGSSLPWSPSTPYPRPTWSGSRQPTSTWPQAR